MALAKPKTKTPSKRKTAPVTVPVLLPLALPAPYDYLVPDGMSVEPGQFVVVPLGPVERLGVVWPRREGEAAPAIERKKLRAIVEAIDDVPKLPRVSLDFADWVANYTLATPGMVLRMMMSAGSAFNPPAPRYGVRLVGPAPARMTPARARVVEAAGNGLLWVKSSLAEVAGVSPGVIDGLVDAGTLFDRARARPLYRAARSVARPRSPDPRAGRRRQGAARQHASTASPSLCSTASPARARRKSISRPSPRRWSAGTRRSCSCPRSRSRASFSPAARSASARAPPNGIRDSRRPCAAASGARWRRGKQSSWSARARRSSSPSPISASSSSMRSTTRATSRRTASPIRRATWRCCADRSGPSPWC